MSDKFKRKIEALEMALDAYLANSGSIVAGGTNFIAASPPGFSKFQNGLSSIFLRLKNGGILALRAIWQDSYLLNNSIISQWIQRFFGAIIYYCLRFEFFRMHNWLHNNRCWRPLCFWFWRRRVNQLGLWSLFKLSSRFQYETVLLQQSRE